MAKLGMTIDLKRCMGCHTCAIGCKMQNNVPMGMLWNRVLTEGGEEVDSAKGEFPNVHKSWMPVACQHCENAPCVKACPVGATYKDEKGRVLVNYDRCIGCRYCMASCPYNVRTFNWQKAVRQPDHNYGGADVPVRKVGVVEKCSMCKERTDEGLEPMCVKVCPAKARKFGDLDDPNSEVSKAIRERGGEQLLDHKGTKPQIYYLK
ncbi:4Fe-4S dicluster domain-containing protein [Desulfitobacterium hafniense]|uniref:4Fe-4S dicluster domain-containing protein n=1 Tax=Desulfitobacterium hafniense TaxID=49338 RepID=UPI000371A045|nr:4Fe-4S dicluster domain-containing protein [Desulfitobacterium hafniense]